MKTTRVIFVIFSCTHCLDYIPAPMMVEGAPHICCILWAFLATWALMPMLESPMVSLT